jgi:hypothetical protein
MKRKVCRSQLRDLIEEDRRFQERRAALRQAAFQNKKKIAGRKPKRPFLRHAKDEKCSLQTILRQVKRIKNPSVRPRIQIPEEELFAGSLNELATAYGCCKRQISRIREDFRAREKGIAGIDAAKRRLRRRQKKLKNTLLSDQLVIEVFKESSVQPSAVQPVAGQPLGLDSSSIEPESTDWIGLHWFYENVTKFLCLIPIAIEFTRSGGTRDLLNSYRHGDADVSEVCRKFMPTNKNMRSWILRIGGGKSAEESVAAQRLVAGHSTTIAWAMHASDMYHSGLHIHVLSRVESFLDERDFRQLFLDAKGSGDQQVIRTTGPRVLKYFDFNSRREPSLTGVQFGPAAAAEVRILQSLTSFTWRGIHENLHGVFDAADILVGRSRAQSSLGIPAAWSEWVACLLREMQRAADTAMFVENGRNVPHHFLRRMFARLAVNLEVSWDITNSMVRDCQTAALPASVISAKGFETLTEPSDSPFDVAAARTRILMISDDKENVWTAWYRGIGAYNEADAQLYRNMALNENFVNLSLKWAHTRFMYAPWSPDSGLQPYFLAAPYFLTPVELAEDCSKSKTPRT